jgi:methyl-accepting chemotaxis protein
VIAIVLLIVVTAVLAFVATKLAAPAKRVSEAAKQLATGDLNVEVGAYSDDEMAAGRLDVNVSVRSDRDRLGTAYSQMRGHLEDLIRQIHSTSGTVANSSAEMASTSEETGRAVGEIARAACC